MDSHSSGAELNQSSTARDDQEAPLETSTAAETTATAASTAPAEAAEPADCPAAAAGHTEGCKRHRESSTEHCCHGSTLSGLQRQKQQQQQLEQQPREMDEQEQQQQHEKPSPPEAAPEASEPMRACCHLGRVHHRRCCRGAHGGAVQQAREQSSSHQGHSDHSHSHSGSSSSSCHRSPWRRCGCRLGEYIFLLIPRKPLSPGAAFLFSLLQEASPSVRCAVDMGGTLAKLVFIEELGPQSAAAAAAAAGGPDFSRRDPQLAARAYASNCDAALDLASPLLTIRASPRRVLRFTYFRTKAISALLDCLRSRDLVKGGVLRMTGGGAMKYAKLFTEQLGVSLQRTDEIDSIMAGLVLLASHTNSVFRFDLNTRQRVPVDVSRDLYPFLVVNIGSGVSILKAKSASSFVRVTGTCIGGGTVLGLARLLFHAKSFRQVVRLSERGSVVFVIMLPGVSLGTDALDLKVADLCGDAAGSRCIAPDALASSFGRLYLEDSHDRPSPRKEDIARSLIHMVSYNLGYLAYLVGTAHGVRRIFFAGKFINNYDFTMESITQGVNFYMQQYDQHTPQSCLRGPASPLLAAPPNFNVNAQQRILLQQQLLIQRQQQQSYDMRANVNIVVEQLSGSGHTDGTFRPLVGRLDAESAPEVAVDATVLSPQRAATGVVSSGVCIAAPNEDVSPVSMPSRPHNNALVHEQQNPIQSVHEQRASFSNNPLRSPSSTNLLGPPPVQPPDGDSGAPVAAWAPFEVLFLRHDGYLGAVGALVAPGRDGPQVN
ncbi:pantothenate kinase, putative [Eimeria tenella]|uniref:Pantothenate kinase, putative n=1 Tax=Eimeria tenella TaxID=5802 RepID=U6KMP5_EIMTE|nr:pantothenate kinase, putative [Eimeria tenella]CDJ37547.1 pantothenate kinase, putative [Eimeria tenella]|eukprot:XP_013228385.1 pantothenate kinase, putative [Eimeria tenella]